MVAALALGGIASQVSWPFPETEEEVSLPLSSEARLARSAAQGRRDAFAALVEEHKRAVYGLCLRLLSDPEEARDAAQEAFARAFAALEGFDPAQSFAPWILRIARNHCLDVLRRRIPARAKVELDATQEDGAAIDLPDPQAARGDEALERSQARQALGAAVAALPPNYREVVHLFHVEQLSYKEIAEAMGVPMGTVMTWLHRARSQLRESLAGKEVEP
ncbi:MAG TPA: sigma-70 family RNA polymerase sigma factor [Anaeromyxobacteraceae bacterium]|nr:sigma-70 family RNA polymerase sigma factor [Anaeromyxobacteraceae bacterium]